MTALRPAPSTTRRLFGSAVGFVLVVMSACTSTRATPSGGAPRAPSTTSSTTTPTPSGSTMGEAVPSGRAVRITSPTGQAYVFSGDARTTTITAPETITDQQIRSVFWDPRTPSRRDHGVCMTWDDPATSVDDPHPQPGLAFRIAPSGADGRGVRLITITQNVFAGAIWNAWVNTWDTSVSAEPDPVAQFDLYPVVHVDTRSMRKPWHVCGRVRGDVVAFKVWVDGPEPAWSNPRHVFTTRLPPGWDTPGHAGGYISHLRAGGKATFSDIEVDRSGS